MILGCEGGREVPGNVAECEGQSLFAEEVHQVLVGTPQEGETGTIELGAGYSLVLVQVGCSVVNCSLCSEVNGVAYRRLELQLRSFCQISRLLVVFLHTQSSF